MSQTKKSARFSFRHKCELQTRANEDLLSVPSPYDPLLVRWKYNFRTIFTIDMNHDTRNVFRSQAAFFREKVRHLSKRDYRYVIHPLSNFARRYHLYMTFMWLVAFSIPPSMGSFSAVYLFKVENFTADRTPFYNYMIAFNAVMLIDVIMRFKLGYIIHKTREIVLEPRRVSTHYLMTYFLFDFTPTVCAFIVSIFPNLPFLSKLFLYHTFILRFARVKSMYDGFAFILRYYRLPNSLCSALLIYLNWLIFVHWWTCFLKFVNVVRDEFRIPYNASWITRLNQYRGRLSSDDYYHSEAAVPKHIEYLNYFSVIISHFFGASVGHYKTGDFLDMFIFALLVISSLTIYLVSLALLLQSFELVNMSESRYDEILLHAEQYMVTKRFPPHLRKRVSHYYDYKFDKKYFSEQVILDSLSDHLQMEVLLYSCQHMINRVSLFKGLSKAAVGCILALLKQEIYLPNDVIMRADDEDGTLYFILFGTCGVMLLTGQEAMHIEDGSHFGENSNFTKNYQHDFLYMVVALEACEVYSLSQEDVRYCCKNYPEIADKIESMLSSKARHYMSVLAKASVEEEKISATDIIEQLRKGRILRHGRRRWRPLDAYLENN